MAKRKKKNLKSSREASGEPRPDPVDQRDHEAFIAAVREQLELSECETIEEVQAKLDRLLQGKTIDEVVDSSGVSSRPHFAALDALREIDWENDTPQEIRKTAKKALVIDPACCDACVVLAQLEEKPEEQQTYLEQAVEAGRNEHAELIETLPENGTDPSGPASGVSTRRDPSSGRCTSWVTFIVGIFGWKNAGRSSKRCFGSIPETTKGFAMSW